MLRTIQPSRIWLGMRCAPVEPGALRRDQRPGEGFGKVQLEGLRVVRACRRFSERVLEQRSEFRFRNPLHVSHGDRHLPRMLRSIRLTGKPNQVCGRGHLLAVRPERYRPGRPTDTLNGPAAAPVVSEPTERLIRICSHGLTCLPVAASPLAAMAFAPSESPIILGRDGPDPPH